MKFLSLVCVFYKMCPQHCCCHTVKSKLLNFRLYNIGSLNLIYFMSENLHWIWLKNHCKVETFQHYFLKEIMPKVPMNLDLKSHNFRPLDKASPFHDLQSLKRPSQCFAILERLTWHKSNKLSNILKIIYIIV